LNDFENRIFNNIKSNNLIEDKDTIVLGVSGGPDSIAMLEALNEIKNNTDLNFEIVVAHINHGIRENAVLDEQFVLDFCKNKNIQCYVLHSKVQELAKQEKKGLEETGRKVRYNFFDEILEKVNGSKIAIAHNKKDNVETIIMNALRGCGINGLRGIEVKQGKYIRPLINESREDIESYLEEKGINPRIDESNFENEYTRNKIRNIILPYIQKEFNPNFIEGMTRLSDIIKEEDDYLYKVTKKEYKRILIEEKNINTNVYNNENMPTIILDLKAFNGLDRVIEKRIILYAIKRLFGTTKGIEKIHIDDIIKLCNNNIGNKFLTPNKKTKIVIKNKKIYIIAKK
jgi:tRNA(Ile)-lysidine synthase